MTTYNLVMDLAAGVTNVVGKDGRRYTMQQVDVLEAAAAGGDPTARATLRTVDYGLDGAGATLSPAELRAVAEQIVHDCPECQAARACGELPVVWDATDLVAPWTANPARRRKRERRSERQAQRRRDRGRRGSGNGAVGDRVLS